ncbi:esterase/lipase family protein [Acidobacteriota bacterium]
MAAIQPVVLIPGLGIDDKVVIETDAAGPANAFDHIASWIKGIFGSQIHIEKSDREERNLGLVRNLETAGSASSVGIKLPRHLDAGLISVFLYDWQAEIQTSAARLSEALESLSKETGGRLVDLVCHGTGGLVARYYIESGKFRSAKEMVGRLILIGVPNYGIPLAFSALLNILKKTGKPEDTLRSLVAVAPALFQLLPPTGHPFIYLSDDPVLKVEIYRTPHLWGARAPGTMPAKDKEGELPAPPVPDDVLFRIAELNASLHGKLKGYYHFMWRNTFCLVGTGFDTMVQMIFDFDSRCYLQKSAEPSVAAGDGIVPWGSALLYPSVKYMPMHSEHARFFEHGSMLELLSRLLN